MGYAIPDLYKVGCFNGYIIFDVIVTVIGRFFYSTSFLMHLNSLN